MFKPFTMPDIRVPIESGLPSELYTGMQKHRIEEWAATVDEFGSAASRTSHDRTFLAAYNFIDRHPLFYDFFRPVGDFPDGWIADEAQLQLPHGMRFLKFSVTLVDPSTGFVAREPHKNTRVHRAAEIGPVQWPTQRTWMHPSGVTIDSEVSCHGTSMEDLTIRVADRIYDKYGTDRHVFDAAEGAKAVLKK